MTMLDTKKLNKLWAKSTDLNNPIRERHMFDLAFFLWNNRQFDESIAVSGALIEIMADRPGEGLWIDAMHLQSLALHSAKREGEAIEAELLALEYGETLEPASERAYMHWHLADCYRANEQPDLQEAEYLKAIDAFIESENKWYLGEAYIDIANLHYGARRYEQSKTYFKLAIPVLEETQRTDKMPFVKYRLAGVERNTGNALAALSYAEEALALSKFSGDATAERENRIEIAQIHVELGNVELALGILDSLIEDNDEIVKNRTAAKATYYKAKTLAVIGKADEAAIQYELAIPLLKVVDQENLAINSHLALVHAKTAGPLGSKAHD